VKKVYVSDTNIWIDFRNAGLLEALFQLPFTLCSTDFVVSELHDLPVDRLVELGLRVEGIDAQGIAELYALSEAQRNSSLADVSCYFLARLTGHPLLTGDGRLRKQAARDGLDVFGVLWLLDRLVEFGVIEPARAAAALEAMVSQGARLPSTECQLRLQAWRV